MKEIEKKYMPLFIMIAMGFLVLAMIFPFIVNAFFSDWTKSGSFGDTFGALNALFSGLALAGVVVTILIQRTELFLQRNEMKETRQEFLINRTTSLVYKQLDKFEKALSKLKIRSPNGTIFQGNEAIFYLGDYQKNLYKSIIHMEQEPSADMKAALIELLKVHSLNYSEIENFSHSTYTSVEVLKRLIFKTDLEVKQIKDLKNLFFVNIGFVNMAVIQRICETPKFIKHLNSTDYIQNNLNAGAIMSPNIFLESIIEFYLLQLTQENFAEEKSKWLESVSKIER